ncbi:ROK family transcriptional regulator [Phytohabitans aurantiacus]|uniref:Sugar kinase n=1 Tax=Phytohabitans aurantiacus TaxID=3016789 RepID=A0ABQ5QYP9_9ACTN|nr:ROK family transcriptional regulator [Phytohabitans aurantiacus]GLH99683.1 sugar kinase [Phytohabitans aurantiacus]
MAHQLRPRAAGAAGGMRNIRKAHRLAVLREIYAAGAATRRDLAARADVSVATASNIVAELIRAGVVRETSYEESDGGRPRGRITVDARRGALVGVEVRASSIHIDVYDLALEPRTQRIVPATSRRDLARVVSAALAQAGIDAGRLAGVGIAAPAGPHRAWLDPAVLPAPVHVAEPATAAAVGELWLGPSRHAANLVSVTLADSAGATVLVGGAPLATTGGWGHTTVVLDGRPCSCGRRGCVESYLGAPGILQTVRELAPGSRLARDTPEATVRELGRAIRDGDPAAAAVIDATGRHLGIGIARLVSVIDPDAVALNGWVVGGLGRWLLPAAREELARRRWPSSVRIEASPVPRNAVTAGVAAAALQTSAYLATARR